MIYLVGPRFHVETVFMMMCNQHSIAAQNDIHIVRVNTSFQALAFVAINLLVNTVSYLNFIFHSFIDYQKLKNK